MLVYATGVWPAGAVKPAGVLYLEFDWDKQIGELISDHCLFIDGGRGRTTISIVDRSDRVVSTSGDSRFGTRCLLNMSGERGRLQGANDVSAFATSAKYQGFDGLGLRCVIEQTQVMDCGKNALVA